MNNWREHIQAAIDHTDGKWAMGDIEEKLRQGTARLLLTENSAAVIWVDHYPQRKALTVAFAGGNLDDILAHIPGVEAYAKQLGVDQIDIYGRKGWERVLNRHGFRQTSTIMSRSV